MPAGAQGLQRHPVRHDRRRARGGHPGQRPAQVQDLRVRVVLRQPPGGDDGTPGSLQERGRQGGAGVQPHRQRLRPGGEGEVRGRGRRRAGREVPRHGRFPRQDGGRQRQGLRRLALHRGEGPGRCPEGLPGLTVKPK